MKILIDARLYGLENAGLGRYVMNLIDGLAALDKKNEYVVLLRKKYQLSLNLPENWKKVAADWRHYSLAEQIEIPLIIKKENPDIAHFPHFNVPVFYRGNFVVTIHDMLMHQSVGLSATTLSLPKYIFKRIGYRLVFDSAVRKSKAVIVPSKFVGDEISRIYGIPDSKIRVSHLGVDKRINLSVPQGLPDKYFVYVGNAYPHKNLKRLIEAIVLLNKKYSQDIKLVIASARTIFTQRLTDLVEKMSVKDTVKILGFVDDEKLGGLMKKSIGFVFPSVSEGFGLPGLEALSTGTLLLASNIKVFREIYEDNALYFDQTSPEAMAETMLTAMSLDKSERERITEKGKLFVNKYSWSKMCESVLDIYEEFARKKNQDR